jgi:hypothetical protein
MGRLIITEQEKKDILDKYQDDTDSKILTYLRRHCPVSVIDNEFYKGMHYVLIDDKAHIVEKNKKYSKGEVQINLEIIFETLVGTNFIK